MPKGVADTTTNLFFPERIETVQDDYPKDTLFPFLYRNTTLPVVLERLLHQIGSCRAAADNANMFLVPSKIAQHIWQKRFRTNSINNMRRGRTKFLTFPNKTDRNTRFLYCLRHSNFHVMELSCLVCPQHVAWCHIPGCFLETECHALPRHVVPYQTTSRSLIQFDSGTHQLENNSPRHVWFSLGNKKTQKEQNKRTTSRRRQLLAPLCKATSVATTSACSEQQLNTRQNRCLHSFCKSCGAGVSHNVQGEIEFGERGVRLLILHTSDSPCQRTSGCTHACCHTLLQPA